MVDAVRAFDGADAVGDGEDGWSLVLRLLIVADQLMVHDFVEGLLDRKLRATIECAGRLVEQNNLRRPYQRPRDGDSLLLASTELRTRGTNLSVIACWQLLDDGVHKRSFCCGNHLIFCGLRFAHFDIVTN